MIVRERAPKRLDRTVKDTLEQAINDDVFALVTCNSVAATEDVFHVQPVKLLY